MFSTRCQVPRGGSSPRLGISWYIMIYLQRGSPLCILMIFGWELKVWSTHDAPHKLVSKLVFNQDWTIHQFSRWNSSIWTVCMRLSESGVPQLPWLTVMLAIKWKSFINLYPQFSDTPELHVAAYISLCKNTIKSRLSMVKSYLVSAIPLYNIPLCIPLYWSKKNHWILIFWTTNFLSVSKCSAVLGVPSLGRSLLKISWHGGQNTTNIRVYERVCGWNAPWWRHLLKRNIRCD